MNLIIGGAYQGKLDFAKSAFGYEDKDVFTCHGTEIDFSTGCVDHVEEFVLACVEQGIDPVAYFEEHRSEWHSCTLICEDLFCGVVPLGADMRAWRHNTGLLCQYLSQNADRVSRIFCGLEQRLK